MADEGTKLPEDNTTGTYHRRTQPCSKDDYQRLKMCRLIERTAGTTAEWCWCYITAAVMQLCTILQQCQEGHWFESGDMPTQTLKSSCKGMNGCP